jgi:hypothetical protein
MTAPTHGTPPRRPPLPDRGGALCPVEHACPLVFTGLQAREGALNG